MTGPELASLIRVMRPAETMAQSDGMKIVNYAKYIDSAEKVASLRPAHRERPDMPTDTVRSGGHALAGQERSEERRFASVGTDGPQREAGRLKVETRGRQKWDHAAANIVKLDLKQSDRRFLHDLITFVASHGKSRRVIMVSGDRDVLLYLHSRLPDVPCCSARAHPDAVHHRSCLDHDPEYARNRLGKAYLTAHRLARSDTGVR
jgi:hypothetical protein